METKTIKAFGTEAADKPLHSLQINRRVPEPHDVEIEILYCGICHSDLHASRDEWGGTKYPIVPGHEIVGRVTNVGNHVTKFKVGDIAAIGCIVDSCRECDYCKEGMEQFCEPGNTIVFGSRDKNMGGYTFGGFSESIVADENYVLHVPAGLDLAAAAPLLCAGITVYSPLKHWKTGPGKKIGIIGIGGLGHLAIKIAKAMGAHVIVFTTSISKAEDAERLGADEVVLSTDARQMKKQSKLDMILDTVSANHNVNDYLKMLKVDGSLVLVGLPVDDISVEAFKLVKGRKSFSGSNIGGIAETQEMLDFCAAHNITAEIEMITMQQINEAYDRMEKGDVRYRFVIDMATLKN
ncbi:MAG: NAD(P)-dependent alcohol dehydrogenase [Saprospiraceae bacterium]|uniref:NAD(P)-dependent alcohol dehydrogenase n=1 Tax=Candidatus Opimibacter skivensis TaxID=2982028 RepID=A0A9D7SZI8_9BACT|nr:NAD(P)-dependent alcohol dehydrogenase [Candidatus Opimibacter skivensis]